jgi:hypothetical protein
LETISQGFPFQVFHHQVINAVLLADIVERADVGMIQRRNRACLPIEPLLGFGVLGQM